MQPRIKQSHSGSQTCILSTTSCCSKGWSLKGELCLRDKRKQLIGQKNVERVRCYRGQERIEFQDGATSKLFQILQREPREWELRKSTRFGEQRVIGDRGQLEGAVSIKTRCLYRTGPHPLMSPQCCWWRDSCRDQFSQRLMFTARSYSGK